jgi:hypothetical protein
MNLRCPLVIENKTQAVKWISLYFKRNFLLAGWVEYR